MLCLELRTNYNITWSYRDVLILAVKRLQKSSSVFSENYKSRKFCIESNLTAVRYKIMFSSLLCCLLFLTAVKNIFKKNKPDIWQQPKWVPSIVNGIFTKEVNLSACFWWSWVFVYTYYFLVVHINLFS